MTFLCHCVTALLGFAQTVKKLFVLTYSWLILCVESLSTDTVTWHIFLTVDLSKSHTVKQGSCTPANGMDCNSLGLPMPRFIVQTQALWMLHDNLFLLDES
jgi:hypothetical protein